MDVIGTISLTFPATQTTSKVSVTLRNSQKHRCHWWSDCMEIQWDSKECIVNSYHTVDTFQNNMDYRILNLIQQDTKLYRHLFQHLLHRAATYYKSNARYSAIHRKGKASTQAVIQEHSDFQRIWPDTVNWICTVHKIGVPRRGQDF